MCFQSFGHNHRSKTARSKSASTFNFLRNFKVDAPFYIPTSSIWGFWFLRNTYYLFDHSHLMESWICITLMDNNAEDLLIQYNKQLLANCIFSLFSHHIGWFGSYFYWTG